MKKDIFYVTIKVKLAKPMHDDDIAELVNEVDYAVSDVNGKIVETEIMGFSSTYSY